MASSSTIAPPVQRDRFTRQQIATMALLIMGGGTVFKLSSIKDVFYVPMQESWGLTNAQIGLGLTIYAVVQTLTYLASPYLADRFSKKYLLAIGLLGVGGCGVYLATLPSLGGFLMCFGLLGLFGEAIFWPALLKAVSNVGNDQQQGRLFGFLEAGRGVVDVIVAFTALGIFVAFGSGRAGMQAGILWYAGITAVVGIILFFRLDASDQIRSVENPNAEVFRGIRAVISRPETWMAAFVIFFIYCSYAGLTYFIPFLREIYGLPIALVGAYGIINQYALKMVGGPVGGFISDKLLKSSLKFLVITSAVTCVGILMFSMLPHQSMPIWLGMSLTLAFGAVIFSQRGVFFAPITEIGTPSGQRGAALAIGCLIGYAPSLFAFYIYGSMLDNFPGMAGYRYVFYSMAAFSAMGFLLSFVLLRRIRKQSVRLAG